MSAYSFSIPKNGVVLFSKGENVSLGKVLIKAEIFKTLTKFAIASVLEVKTEEIFSLLKKKAGDEVKKGEIIAEKKGGILGKDKTVCSPGSGKILYFEKEDGKGVIGSDYYSWEIKSPGNGTIEEISDGKLVVDFQGKEISLKDGKGETVFGEMVCVSDKDSDVSYDQISETVKNKILLGFRFGKLTIVKACALGTIGILGVNFPKEELELRSKEINIPIGILEEKDYNFVIGSNCKFAIFSGELKKLCLLKQ